MRSLLPDFTSTGFVQLVAPSCEETEKIDLRVNAIPTVCAPSNPADTDG